MLTFKIILYRQKTYKDGTHPVMLQTMENRKAKRISLGHSCLPTQWDDAKGRFKKTFANHDLKNADLSQIESKADLVIASAKIARRTLTSEQFLAEFQGKKVADLFGFLTVRKQELHEQGKAGTRLIYIDTENALNSFHKSSSLPFDAVDYNFLIRFEAFLRGRGCRDGGISAYMRTIRSLYNEAIRRGLAEKDSYPFSMQFNKNGYSIAKLKSDYIPRALSEADIEKLKHFSFADYPAYRTTWLMFLFSFYCRGMAYSDLAKLKWVDIYDGRLAYSRKKSKSKLTMKLHEKALLILEYFRSESEFVFPVLSAFHQSPQQIVDRIKKTRKQYNDQLRAIAKLLGIEINLTSHGSRHSFSMHLKRKGVSTAIISQALGHSGEEVTRHYLAKFEDDEIDQTNDLL